MSYLEKTLIKTALGRKMADKVVCGGKLINVYTGRISQMDVAISGSRIAAIGEVAYCTGPETEIIRADGCFLSPGLIEPHFHPEVSKATMTAIANAVLPRGNTTVMCAMDQIGVVLGFEGMRTVLDEALATPLKVFHAGPSRLPYTTPASTIGCAFGPQDHAVAQTWDEAVGIWEFMSDSVVDFDEAVFETAELTHRNKLLLHGHAPAESGPVLSACVAAGMRDDHECITVEGLVEKLSNGIYCFIRRNTKRDSIDELVRAVTELGIPTTYLSLCTDDLDCLEILELGLIDYMVRRVISAGIDPISAIQMATINPARAYNLDQQIGSITPGRSADILLLSDLATFDVDSVIADGVLIAENDRMIHPVSPPVYPENFLNTVRLDRPLSDDDLYLRTELSASYADVMAIHLNRAAGPPHQRKDFKLSVSGGLILPDIEQDVLYISVTERYTGKAKTSTGFIHGFSLNSGAMATSLSPDDNNIVTIGASVPDMVIAINRIREMGGGQVVVDHGEVAAEIPLPLCGLMIDCSVSEIADMERHLNRAAHKLGTDLHHPFFYLMFLSITAIPQYAITDMGVVERATREIIDPLLKVY